VHGRNGEEKHLTAIRQHEAISELDFTTNNGEKTMGS